MENIRNTIGLSDIGEGARRQYVNARSVFTALEDASRQAAQYRGGMYWKTHGKTGIMYLIRTQTDNSQTSLGPHTAESEAIYRKFTESKSTIEARIRDLTKEMDLHRRLNRALLVGRAPQLLVDIMNVFSRAGIAEHFRVIGTHAIYAYEAAAGVRIEKESALETQDVDLLWAIERKIKFQTRLKQNADSVIGLLKKVDKTFEVRPEQRYTAVNSRGFEVDIIRPATVADEDTVALVNPSRMTDYDDDLFAVKAPSAGGLQGAPPFEALIVSTGGSMARMRTVHPLEFVRVKRWLSHQPTRDIMKRDRDRLQAAIVEKLVEEYLPQLTLGHVKPELS